MFSWVTCLDNIGYESSLERGKLYQSIKDGVSEKDGLLWIIDESGEGYYYPKSFFSSGNDFSIAIEQLKNRIKIVERQIDSIKEALTGHLKLIDQIVNGLKSMKPKGKL